MKRNHYKLFTIFIIFGLSFSSSNCKKFVEVNAPVTNANAANVFQDDETAAAALTGLLTNLAISNFSDGGIASTSLFASLSADELTLFELNNNKYLYYYRNELNSLNTGSADFWRNIYPNIYIANSCIEGLSNAPKLTPVIKAQLLGEAKFIRAFCYFYLVNLYGGVPLVLNTDYTANSLLARASKEEVYQQIILDLQDAKANLSDKYLMGDALTKYPNGSEEKVRPNKMVATALLSRVYLYTGNYANAEVEATSIIESSNLFSLVDLQSTFLKASREAIWQLQPVYSGQNTQEAMFFILPESGPSSLWPVTLSKQLLQSFEVNDKRKIEWVDSVVVNNDTFYFPHKYKNNILDNEITSPSDMTEYDMVFRLSEQYLIRSEARALQNKLTAANEDLNYIRKRAGLETVQLNDQDVMLSAILQERKVELFTEWGHRWFDLKRTGEINSVMPLIALEKGGGWNENWQYYPISLTELQRNRYVTQNPGY